MVKVDVLVAGGRVVTAAGEFLADVAVRNGRISGLLQPGTDCDAKQVVDAKGLLVMPGGIDPHTHVNWPYNGTSTDDDFFSAGSAAALGGTTTLCDFVPPQEEDEDLLSICSQRIQKIEGHSAVDVALHPIIIRADTETLDAIPKLIAMGCTSFKMFTTFDGRRLHEGEIWRLMREMVKHGGLPGFHAENHEILREAEAVVERAKQLSVGEFHLSRPQLAESVAISAIAPIAREIGTAFYVFHVSGAEALSAIEDARRAGGVVFAETCTHYLVFNDEVYDRPDAWKFEICPAVRSEGDRTYLWRGMATGSVDAVGSDHCAYPISAKTAHLDDHRLNPPGAAGLQSRTPVLWQEAVNVHGLTPSDFVRISSESPARALSMFPRKGSISVGADADLVLWNPVTPWTGRDFPKAHSDTFDLYDDYRGQGRAQHVLLGGKVIVRDGEYRGTPGDGSFVRRRPTNFQLQGSQSRAGTVHR